MKGEPSSSLEMGLASRPVIISTEIADPINERLLAWYCKTKMDQIREFMLNSSADPPLGDSGCKCNRIYLPNVSILAFRLSELALVALTSMW